MKSVEEQIFEHGSTTYYLSSKFFPKKVRQDVFKLYSFVRVADDYVDAIPQQTKEFKALRTLWSSSHTTTNIPQSLNQRVVQNMHDVTQKYAMDPAWVESFLDAMQADVQAQTLYSLEDSLGYVYGSAEVVGLMMSKIMGLSDQALPAAQMQGRAMQWINFVRDIAEDNTLGRQYFPVQDLTAFNLKDLSAQTAQANPDNFKKFIHFQLDRYEQWQTQAYAGYPYIPRRLRIPLQTATDMYNWTAQQIRSDPTIVFRSKVKPRKRRVLLHASKVSFKTTAWYAAAQSSKA